MPPFPPSPRTAPVPARPAPGGRAVGAAGRGARATRSPAALATLACVALLATPIAVRADAPADLPVLERAWHGCVREAYDGQPERGPKEGPKEGTREASRGGRERLALAACKAHEDAYVSALMASRPEDDALSLSGWARTWAAYVAIIVDPVAAWFEALRR